MQHSLYIFGKGNSHESKQRQYRTISEESLMILADLMAFHLISAMMTKTSHNKMNIILCQLVQVQTIDNQNLRNEVKKLDQNPNLDLFQGQGDRLFSNLPIKLRYSFPIFGLVFIFGRRKELKYRFKQLES